MVGKSAFCSVCLDSDSFYKLVGLQIEDSAPGSRALVSLDFDNFNFINDLFGYDAGDVILYKIEEIFSSRLLPGEHFTRLHADHFIFWVNCGSEDSLVKRFLKLGNLKKDLRDILPANYSFVCSGGIIVLSPITDSVTALLDRANFARKRAKGKHESNFLYFDSVMEEDLRWKKITTLTMEQALNNREYEMYLQPKILMKTGQLVGAEALVRWNSREYGIIYPDRFIPVLEQNGFIKNLDFFMLNEACRFIKKRMEEKKPLIPILVNFSKSHIREKSFVDDIFKTVSWQGIPPKLIEIEFTENVFSNDLASLTKIVEGLKQLGFRISLDDFGKAYSSLNLLKDLPLDIVKIDKDFLSPVRDTGKGWVIVSKMIELIKSLRFVSVMEGVETAEQASFLQKMGCDMGQGFFYKKPLNVLEFEKFASESSIPEDADGLFSESYLSSNGPDVDHSHIIPEEFQMDNWELYVISQNVDMGMMKGYLDRDTTVQYINSKALDYLGYTREKFREECGNDIMAFVHPEDKAKVNENMDALIKTGRPVKFRVRAVRQDGRIIILQGTSTLVNDEHGRPVGIHAYQDVTEETEVFNTLQKSLEDKLAELEEVVNLERSGRSALLSSEERYRLIVEQSEDVVFEWDLKSDLVDFSEKFKVQFGYIGMQNNMSMSTSIKSRVHPDDVTAFSEFIGNARTHKGAHELEFRMSLKKGGYVWVRIRCTSVGGGSGELIRSVGVFSNINQQKCAFDALTLKAQLDPLTRLLNKDETKYHIENAMLSSDSPAAFMLIDIDDFKVINDSLGHQFGDTVMAEMAERIKKAFRDTDVIGRLGGDEVSIFMRHIISEESALDKAEQLLCALRGTYFGESSRYRITVSIGVTFYPKYAKSYEELYNTADIALLQAKRDGKNRYVIYNGGLTTADTKANTPVEWPDRFLNTYFSGDPIFNVFQMLYETKDIKTTIETVLEHLGRKFHVDRAYILEASNKSEEYRYTFEWCATGISPQIGSLQSLPIAGVELFDSFTNDEGVFICNDVSKLDAVFCRFLQGQGIKSTLVCSVCSEGRSVGLIGFDSCKKQRVWHSDEIATLGYISRILSVFVIKNRISLELLDSYHNHLEVLENLTGYVYVMDPDTYEILYVNGAMKGLGVGVGEKCFKSTFFSDTPCEICPVKRFKNKQFFTLEDIFLPVLGKQVHASASKINWVGHENALLVCCNESVNKTP